MKPPVVYAIVRCVHCDARAETRVSACLDYYDDGSDDVTDVELWPDTPDGWELRRGDLFCGGCK